MSVFLMQMYIRFQLIYTIKAVIKTQYRNIINNNKQQQQQQQQQQQ